MERALLVYTTFPDEAAARAAAAKLVARRLAACVNILPGMVSVYAWKGAIEEAREVVAIVKTREGRAEDVRAALKELHPYETPVILFLPASEGDAATLAWLFAETGGTLPAA